MNKILFFVFIFLTVSIIHAQTTYSDTTKPETASVGIYFETIIPPFIKQINNNASALFLGSFTYMDFGLGVSFLDDILKAQINYGFMTQGLYKSLGGIGNAEYGGNVISLKFFICPEFNLGSIFTSKDSYIVSASIGLGSNFSLFEYTPSGSNKLLYSWDIQLEFPKITNLDRKYFRSFSIFIEHQLWFLEDTDIGINAKENPLTYNLVLGIRMYIF
jgi:hypothetical protein